MSKKTLPSKSISGSSPHAARGYPLSNLHQGQIEVLRKMGAKTEMDEHGNECLAGVFSLPTLQRGGLRINAQ